MVTNRVLKTAIRWGLGALCAVGFALPVAAETATIAVAANFQAAAQRLADRFTTETGHELHLATGSTGKLYAQITQGAPFDLFLSADRARPERLEAEGRTLARATYATGILAQIARADNRMPLSEARVALADPALAPYGAATQEALNNWGWALTDLDVVYGENVGQTAAFLISGNVDVAFVAYSQALVAFDTPEYWVKPIYNDALLHQDMVLLRENAAARAFYDYLQTDASREVIIAAGYTVPETEPEPVPEPAPAPKPRASE